MKEKLKEIVLMQQRRLHLQQPTIKREQYQNIVDYIKLPHSVVVTGLRRCGKSTILTQILTEYFPSQFYYLNFEDERLLSFTVADFSLLYEVFVELFGEKTLFYFDEIQNIPHWEVYVRRMQDDGFKFFITGSNAAMLSKEMGTKLTGRHVSVELYPFSFKEYLAFCNMDSSAFDFYDPKARGLLKKYFTNYLEMGGMPEYLKYQDQSILMQVYEDILFRDIITRYEIKDIKALRELGLYLMSNPARLFSYNKLKNSLQFGSVNTVKNYIDYLENSYLISCLTPFSHSLHQQNVANKKSYAIDNGLMNAISFQFSKNQGPFLENLVYLELKRRGHDIYYYKTAKNLEVDFLLREGKELTQLLQVCHDLSETKTKNREINTMVQAMDETGIRQALLLTHDMTEEIHVDNKKIRLMPVYQWVLDEL